MSDKRFNNEDIFQRRSKEWNWDRIEECVTTIFKNIDVLENWRFVKTEWDVRKSFSKEELKKSLYRTLKVHINEMTKVDTVKKEHVYSIQVPELIDRQYFYIGGLYKVPIFQLYDYPIIYRETSRNQPILKFKNNVMMLDIKLFQKKNPIVNLFTSSFVCKNIPIELIITSYLTKDEFNEFWDSLPNYNDTLFLIRDLCYATWDNFSHIEILKKLGEFRSSNINSDKEKKGRSIVSAIKYSYDIDFFTKKFMKTSNPIFELLNALSEGTRSDLDLQYKRVRFSEYILAELIKKVYEMICTLQFTKKVKYKITQSVLMDVCNVSDIIHYKFPYNPVGEVASLLQLTLTGPGGFEKESVPAHLKNLHDSHQNYICPADTPDRDSCGVVLNMVPGVNLDEDGRFIKPSDNVSSFPITMVPFLGNNDQTRLQMASNQIKQSLLLVAPETPIIDTGTENKFLEYTSFYNKAKEDGVVIYVDEKCIVVIYDNEDIEPDLFILGVKPLYLNGGDIVKTNLKEGDMFSKNDVITYSKFLDSNELSFGQNLLTGVVIYNGYNYEDGIVISEDIVDKFTSIHTIDLSFNIQSGQILLSLEDDVYKPLPTIGDVIKRGDAYAKIKHLNGEDGLESINIDPDILTVPEDCIISDIEIYPNVWNKQVPQFHHFITSHIQSQTDTIKKIKKKLGPYIKRIDFDRFINNKLISHLNTKAKVGNYTEKGNKLTGVRVKITAMFKDKIQIGDKLSNRYGGKGVVSNIVPKNKMPVMPDGRRLDIVINTLGIPSRMNLGQLYELHLTEAMHNLNETLTTIDNVKSQKKYVEEFFNMVDTTDKKWVTKQGLRQFKKHGYIKNITIPPFSKIHPTTLQKIVEHCNSQQKYRLYNSETNEYFLNDVSCGYMYFMKLVHRSANKILSRSIGPYNTNTMQPVGGGARKGGHKLGEMEVWCLLAHGADEVVKEFLTTQSDSVGKKNRLLADILNTNQDVKSIEKMDDTPQAFRLFESYLKVLGLEILDQ